MGGLNFSPYNFSYGGKFNKKKLGIKHAEKMFLSGASVIDVGGESTSPVSKGVNLKV